MLVVIKQGFALCAAVFLTAVLFTPFYVSADESFPMVLNDTNEPPFTTVAHDGFIDIVATEAFRRVGATLKLIKLPAERGLINANAGIEDGDMVRIAGLEKLYPNLIRVPEKVIDWEFVAYTKNPRILANWPSIHQYVVGHVRGWKIYEHHLKGAEHIVTAKDPEQLFRLLARDRIEVALYTRWMGEALIDKNKFKGIYRLTPPLEQREMFIYLHKRHADLVPKIASALRDLKKEGFYQKVQREKFLPYTDKGRR